MRQRFEGPTLEDVPGEVGRQLARLDLSVRRPSGAERGHYGGQPGDRPPRRNPPRGGRASAIMGLKPFIVPAMGSHGGGTADEQQEVVESYGVTESFVGCPIRSGVGAVSSARRLRVFRCTSTGWHCRPTMWWW